MSLPRLKSTLHIDIKTIDPVDITQLKYTKLLNAQKFRTSIEPDGISFNKIIHSTAQPAGREDVFRIFREGDIVFKCLGEKLMIKWLIKLDILYFISILFGIMIGILTRIIAKINLLNSIFIGFIICIISLIIGILIIKSRIDEINEICLIKDY